MLDIFRILDKVIHMEISQILNQTLSTYSAFKLPFTRLMKRVIMKHMDKNGSHSQKIINANDVNSINANSDEMYDLNLKENSKAGFEYIVLKAA